MGEDVAQAIGYFGSRRKIFYVHFRNIRGTPQKFEETFIDDGQTDMLAAMKAYKEVGFDGPIVDDHVPEIVNDTPWRHRSRAFATGYIGGLMKAVESIPG